MEDKEIFNIQRHNNIIVSMFKFNKLDYEKG